ncbi:hypothetical protein OkiPb01104_48070 [Escherichia coli]
MTENTTPTADFSPSKRFFVSMLTRDIDLNDAILDLLDNCVDGALRTIKDTKKLQNHMKDFMRNLRLIKMSLL